MITKQQKFIEDNDIVGNVNQDKNLEIFLDDGINLEDADDEGGPEVQTDAEDNNKNNYISDGGYNSGVPNRNNGQRQSMSSGVDLQIQGIPVTNRQGNSGGHNSKKASAVMDNNQKE